MTRVPSGQAELLDLLAGGVGARRDLELDDLEPLLGQVEQVHEAVLGHLVLDQAQDQVGGRDRRLDAEQLEVLEVARVVAARDHALDAVLLARDLADQDVVLVVAGHRDHEVGALDAGALEHPQLRAVAVLGAVLELLLDDAEARAGRTRSAVISCRLAISSRARFQPTLPAPTMTTYIG